MEELIQRLQSIHGLSAEQSHGILNTITTFIKEKFPMVGGAIDNLFPTGATSSASATPTAPTEETAHDQVHDGGDFLDKIEGFAKDKLGGLFGEDKRVQ